MIETLTSHITFPLPNCVLFEIFTERINNLALLDQIIETLQKQQGLHDSVTEVFVPLGENPTDVGDSK